jgi:hypothetical protein
MRIVSDKNCIESQNTYFMFNNFFFNRAVYEIMWEKYCRVGQAADVNMAHAHCMLGTYVYKYTQNV